MKVSRRFKRIRVFCGVGALLCLGAAGMWAATVWFAPVKPTTDYGEKINEVVVSYQVQYAEQPNVWPELQRVLDRSDELHQTAKAAQVGDLAGAIPDPSVLFEVVGKQGSTQSIDPSHAAAKKLLEDLKSQGVFVELDKLAPRMHAVRMLDGTLRPLVESSSSGEIGSARKLARANIARYRLALMNGDNDEALKAFESGLALGRFLAQQGLTIVRVVGVGIMVSHTEALLRTVDSIADAEVLRKLRIALDRQTIIPSISLSFESERFVILDTIQWTFSDQGDGNGYLSRQGVQWLEQQGMLEHVSGKEIALDVVKFNRKDTTDLVNHYFDEVVNYSTLSIKDRLRSGFWPDAEVEKMRAQSLVLGLMLPAEKRLTADDLARLSFHGTQAVLAIQQWSRAHGGEPPPKLDDLVPQMLSQVPLDPFTGKPLGYKVLAPGSDAAGRRYLVYSFGADGIDDGGVEMSDKPGESGNRFRVLNRTPGTPGFDFVINHVEPPAAAPAKSGN